jgi:hypothetical protein
MPVAALLAEQLLCRIGMISFANETAAVEAPAPHGKELVIDPEAAPAPEPAVAPLVVPVLTVLVPDVAPLLAPELTMPIVPELAPPPVVESERPVRSPHPARVSNVNASGEHHRL